MAAMHELREAVGILCDGTLRRHGESDVVPAGRTQREHTGARRSEERDVLGPPAEGGAGAPRWEGRPAPFGVEHGAVKRGLSRARQRTKEISGYFLSGPSSRVPC